MKMQAMMWAAVVAVLAGAAPPEVSQQDRARRLAADVMSPDVKLRRDTRKDLINGRYQNLTDDERFAAILPALSPPAGEGDPDMQRLLIQYLPLLAGARAKDAVPLLLTYVGDDKVFSYIRGQSLESAVRVAPGDPDVRAALLKELGKPGQPGPRLCGEAFDALGKMGAAGDFAHFEIAAYLGDPAEGLQDSAYMALGQIALARSRARDFRAALADSAAPLEDRSAAQLQLQALAVSGKKFSAEDLVSIRRDLLGLITRRPLDYDARAAIMTIGAVKAGSDPAMIQALIDLQKQSPYINQTLESAEYTDPAAIPVLEKALTATLETNRLWDCVTLARALAHYPGAGKSLAPRLMADVQKLKNFEHNHRDWDLFDAYLGVLSASGGDTPGVPEMFMGLLDVDAPLFREAAEKSLARARVLEALATLAMPSDPALHQRVLVRLVKELQANEFALVMPALLQKIPAAELAPYAERFVPVLSAILARPVPDALPLAATEQERRELFDYFHQSIEALHALAHLGAPARAAEPVIRAMALQPHMPGMYEEMAISINRLTDAAKQTLARPPFSDGP